jgi:lipid II:glycine glycyltransferase (peptidoglycan interpeptide bridge formation enzyme)
MIQVTIAQDKKKWEQYIDMYAPDALFQRWDWGEVNRKQQNDCIRYIYEEHEEIIAIAQVVVVRARRGNFLHVRHGPVLKIWNKRIFHFVMQHLKQIAHEKHCISVRISPRIQKTDSIMKLYASEYGIASAIHAMDAEHAWVLDITKDPDTLLSEMRKTTRYEIRKGEKIGITVTSSSNMDSLASFVSLYKETAKRQHFVPHTGITEEFEVYATEGNVLCITGYVEGIPYASAVILFSGGQAIYHHGASIPSSIPVSYVVQWHAIQEAKKRGMKEYNFWGIAPDTEPKHPWFGLSAFKKGFGGKEVSTIHAYDFPVSWRYGQLYLIEWVRKQQIGYS